MGSSENLRVPDFLNLGSRPRISGPRAYQKFKMATTKNHIRAIFYSYSNQMWGLPVPKSYRSEGQPRSTSAEFPSRAVFGNCRLFQYDGLYQTQFHICELPVVKLC